MEAIVKGKAVKRKKPPADFTAENIDNTAPVKKILDDLQHKHNQAFSFYCKTLRQRRTNENHHNYHFAVTGHPLNAFTEDWDGGLNSGYFEPFTFKSLMPKVITEIKNIDKLDPVTSYMKLKHDWNRERRNLRLSAAQCNMMQKYEKLNDQVVRCPKHLVDMAAHIDSNPDPYFDSSYNWYYAGNGNLHVICIDWVDYLLHSEFSNVYVTLFSKNDIKVNTTHAAIFNCGEGNNILETICSAENIVVLRTKHKIFILKLLNLNDTIEFDKIKVIESEFSYTSISFDKYHKNILYVTSLNCKLTIVNLDRLRGRTINVKNTIASLVDNWNTVVSSDRTYYTHVTRNSVAIYDKRTNQATKMWNALRHITDEVGCNDISVANQPEGTSSLYFGTDHHLFLMDIQFIKNFKPVQRWTHGMQCVPTYMSTCNFEFNKELICLSSQWCEDTCVIVNYTDHMTRETDLRAVVLPYRPPSILKSLHEARQQSLCLDIYNSIDGRLSTSITGSTILEQGENYIILTQNSLGDISSHVLFPEHMETFIDDDSAQELHEWCKAYKVEKKEFEITSMEDISDTWKYLKKVPDNYKYVECRITEKKIDENEIYESFANKQLDSGLLDIWTNAPDETAVETTVEESALNLHYSDSD